jgi:hypothetical protein
MQRDVDNGTLNQRLGTYLSKVGRDSLGAWVFGSLGISLLFSGCDFPAAQETYDDPAAAQVADAPPPVEAPPKPPVTASFASVDEGLKTLVQATDARQKDQQHAAYSWLTKQGEAAVPAVTAVMNDPSVSIEGRRMACHVLASLGPEATPALLAASSSEEVPLKLKAIESLGAVRPSQTEIVDRLIELVDDPSQQVQATAIRGLGFIGPAAKRSADKLQALRNNIEVNETIRGEADRALKLVRPIRTFGD